MMLAYICLVCTNEALKSLKQVFCFSPHYLGEIFHRKYGKHISVLELKGILLYITHQQSKQLPLYRLKHTAYISYKNIACLKLFIESM